LGGTAIPAGYRSEAEPILYRFCFFLSTPCAIESFICTAEH
jgi:hypothetical protein